MKRHLPRLLWATLLAVAAHTALAQADDDGARRRGPTEKAERGERGGRGRQPALVLPADVAALDRLSVLLGRPTRDSVTLNVLSADRLEAVVEFASEGEAAWRRTPLRQLEPGEPAEIELTGLAPGRAQRYRLLSRRVGAERFDTGAEHAFHTQRAPGEAFSFALQGDSHPERGHQFDAAMYAQTLRAAAADRPDFYLTLGDDFSVDTLPELNAATVTQRYRLQRPFLALVGQSAPVFLVNGNHEQAAAANLDGTPHNVAVWAQNARNRLYPQPAPNRFYSGDTLEVPHIGLLRDYHAWTWGDALFVVIDPYWHSPQPVDNALGSRDKGGDKGGDTGGSKGGRDLWNNTLGEAQYRWLRETLTQSRAKYKFVFAHHVLGTGRGGAGLARLYEWGGQDRRGRDEFATRRPGWPEPIHALFVRTGVTIFFQGHDHVSARETLDGVIYQTVPEPADPHEALYFAEAYPGAVVHPNSGHLRVSVDAQRVRVDYRRTAPPGAAPASGPTSRADFSYEVPARR
ncbi:metallophosphoesterase family protein [Roseateles sp. BYS87W]|uniref:Metallophosphoesterase family protein n=1 Tax=Pelomonas baiyunensis TaxID=3299026 RepID=A0ABW7H0I9_9BURK